MRAGAVQLLGHANMPSNDRVSERYASGAVCSRAGAGCVSKFAIRACRQPSKQSSSSKESKQHSWLVKCVARWELGEGQRQRQMNHCNMPGHTRCVFEWVEGKYHIIALIALQKAYVCWVVQI